MKKRNVILGLLAVLMAVGSAIASISMVTTTGYFGYIRASDGANICSPVATCDHPAAFPCKIRATVNNVTKDYQALPVNCPLPGLTHTSGSIRATIVINEPVTSVKNPVLQ